MTDTRMPRGMLSGCQRRAGNLANRGLCKTILIALLSVGFATLRTMFVFATMSLRQKEWWHDMSNLETGDEMKQRHKTVRSVV